MSLIDRRRALPSGLVLKPSWSSDSAARQVIPPVSTYSGASGRWGANGIRINTMVGAVAGAPGVPPTNWTISGLGGPSSQIVGFGTASGVGSLANVDVINFAMVAYPGGNDNGVPDSKASLSFKLKRLSLNATDGAAVDFTLRIGLPQMEQAAFASSPIKTSGTAVMRAADFLSMLLASLRGRNPWQGGILVLDYTLPAYLGPGMTNYGSGIRGTGANFYGAGANQANPNTTITLVAGIIRCMVFGRRAPRAAVAVNGCTPTVINGTLALLANLNSMLIGGDTGTPGNICVGRIAYYAGQRSASFVQRVSR
jgi:hypothetical protein